MKNRAFLSLTAGAVLATHAFGGGIQLYEIAAPEVRLAAAGWAARGQDAATQQFGKDC